MVDSSPQYHRDYLAVICKAIPYCELRELWIDSTRLLAFWADFDADAAAIRTWHDAYEQEEALMRKIRDRIVHHSLPVSLVGFGAADLSQKTHAFLHAIRLECGSHQNLAEYMSSVVCILSDLGTEYGIGLLLRICVSLN
eukprot:1376169-Amphidinium_carterae.1